ncbi:MAG: chemotaxis protein CheD [Halothermotrichaceae bacterium]
MKLLSSNSEVITSQKQKVKKLFAGQYYITCRNNIVLSTLLGSCVSVCLFDEINKVYGMNHYMLPIRKKNKKDNPGKYGKEAIALVIDNMLKKGAKRSLIKAKIFGGGQVAKTIYNNIAEANVKFAFGYLNKNTIPVVASDIGGRQGRQIYFYTGENKVLSRKIKSFPVNKYRQGVIQ